MLESYKRTQRLALSFLCMTLLACASNSPSTDLEIIATTPAPKIIANNAFYYYNNLDAAWVFYRDTLGFETVADYGFAKIMRIAAHSYLTLVQAESGMHTAEEPKTVVLRLITDTGYNLPDGPDFTDRVAVAESGVTEIVVRDPGGYPLTFTSLGNPKNAGLYARLLTELQTSNLGVPVVGIRAAIYSIYMRDLISTQAFYAELLDRDAQTAPGGGTLFHIAGSGFLNLIEGGDHLVEATQERGVTISFFTTDVDAWFARANNTPGFELRTPEVIVESGRVRVFVGYGPEGHFLEWDNFLDLRENADLLKYLEPH